MLELIRFKRSKHSILVFEWLLLRGMNPELAQDLPSFGCVGYLDQKPVAAGFLRRVEGSYCLFDSLITDPRCSSDERHEVLSSLIPHLLEKARLHDFKKVIAYSTDISTLERGLACGFVKQPHEVLILDL